MAIGRLALGVGHRNAHELEADAGTGGDVLGAGEEDLGQGRSDIAAAQQADAYGRRRVGAAARRCAGLLRGHRQTVQGGRTVTCDSAPQVVPAPMPLPREGSLEPVFTLDGLVGRPCPGHPGAGAGRSLVTPALAEDGVFSCSKRKDGQASSRVRSSKVSRRTTTRAAASATKTTAGRGTLL